MMLNGVRYRDRFQSIQPLATAFNPPKLRGIVNRLHAEIRDTP